MGIASYGALPRRQLDTNRARHFVAQRPISNGESREILRRMARPKGFDLLTPRIVVWCLEVRRGGSHLQASKQKSNHPAQNGLAFLCKPSIAVRTWSR